MANQVRFVSSEWEKGKFVPEIEIEMDTKEGTTIRRFVFDGFFPTQDEAGDFIKWFHGLLSDKSRQKNFIYSKDGIPTDDMKKRLED